MAREHMRSWQIGDVTVTFTVLAKDAARKVAYMERLVTLQNRHHAAGLRKAS